jgi:hypothetical protein
MMSAHPLLLGATVATDVFCPLLLSYHCSDGPVTRGHSDLQPIATVLDHNGDIFKLLTF